MDNSAIKIAEHDEDGLTPGTVGWFQNLLGVKQLGIVLDDESLQMYIKKRFGYAPYGLPDSIKVWSMVEEIKTFSYVQNSYGIYLKLHNV